MTPKNHAAIAVAFIALGLSFGWASLMYISEEMIRDFLLAVAVILIGCGFVYQLLKCRCPYCEGYLRNIGWDYCPHCGKNIKDRMK